MNDGASGHPTYSFLDVKASIDGPGGHFDLTDGVPVEIAHVSPVSCTINGRTVEVLDNGDVIVWCDNEASFTVTGPKAKEIAAIPVDAPFTVTISRT